MVAVDTEPLSRYLRVSPLKLRDKGVRSVRSRVCNLCDLVPSLSVGELAEALREAFEEVHGRHAEELLVADVGEKRLRAATARFASRAWLDKDGRHFGTSHEARFDWGTVRLELAETNGSIARAALWSDGLDADELDAAPQALVGVPIEMARITEALVKGAGMSLQMAGDLAGLATHVEGDDHAL